MVTLTQVDVYLTTILEWRNWKEDQRNCNHAEFVTHLVQKFLCQAYFHNLGMLATQPEVRIPPQQNDIISVGLAGFGGICYHQNAWFVILLQALGFEAYIAAGSYAPVAKSPSPEGSHCIGILKLDDSLYAVDVGCGNPVSELIPLNKDQLPYTRIAGGFVYEYRYNEENNWYERWQVGGTILKGKFDDETEAHLRYRFTLRPQTPRYFENILIPTFADETTSKLLQVAFLFRRLGNGESEKFVVIFGKSAAVYGTNDRELREFGSYKDMEAFVKEYFPKIETKMVQAALEYLDNNCENGDI